MTLKRYLVLAAVLSMCLIANGGVSAQSSSQAPTKKVPAPKPLPPGPDLRVTAVSISKVYDCAHANQIVYRVYVQIENAGNRDAGFPRTQPMVKVRHKRDPRWSGTGNFAHLLGAGYIWLAPGKRIDTSVYIKKFTDAPLVMKGPSHAFEAVVDHDSVVAERNEMNNVTEFTAPAVHSCFTVF